MYFLRPDSSGPILSPSRPAQCFTKYKWRDEAAAAGGPAIVATQVVSDFLTVYDDLYMQVSGFTLIVFSQNDTRWHLYCRFCFPSTVQYCLQYQYRYMPTCMAYPGCLQAMNKPVTMYTYKMAFTRPRKPEV